MEPVQRPGRARGSRGARRAASAAGVRDARAESLPRAFAPIARVRKRDGREAPFDRAKIAAAVAAALRAAGEPDPAFAGEVAAVVELALRERCAARRAEAGALGEDGATPTIEEIQDLVEQALIELGRAKAAKAYILYRDRRARIREAVRFEPREGGLGGVRVLDSGGGGTWSKGRIAAALMEEAELPRAVADEVASRVEQRVFDAGLRRLTTGLVRELVAAELVDLGQTRALRRQEPVGLPRHDLRKLFAGAPLEEWERSAGARAPHALESRGAPHEPGALGESAADPGTRVAPVADDVAGAILRRYALEDVLGDEIAEMHLGGDLHIEDLRRPHLPLWLGLPADLLVPDEPGPRAAFDLLDAVASALGAVGRGIVLEDPATALQPLVRGARPKSPLGLAAWLRGLGAVARAAGRRVDLGSPGARASAFAARLVTELDALPPDAPVPRLFLDEEELDVLLADGDVRAAVERLFRRGLVLPTWSAEGERFAAPGCRRRPREHTALASGGAVCLNLPRLARRVGPWREESLFAALADLVRCSLEACRRLATFQARHAACRAGGFRARVSFGLVPVGLRDALRTLGGGEVDPALGARVLGFLGEAARRFASDAGPALVLSPFGATRAAARLAWLDAERERRAGTHQGELFGAARPAADERPYATGFHLSPLPDRWPGEAEGECLATVPSGALDPRAVRGAGGAAFDCADWRRFRAARGASGAAARDLLFPARRVDPTTPR